MPQLPLWKLMTTGWLAHTVVNFFSNDNRMGVPSGSHFQIKW